MRYSCNIQISDLEAVQSDFKQELTIEEAEKVVGGKDNKKKDKVGEASSDAVSIATLIGGKKTKILTSAEGLASATATFVVLTTLTSSPTLPKPC